MTSPLHQGFRPGSCQEDRYRCEICKIIINGVDANLEQVTAGMGWHYKQYAKVQSPKDREDYEVAEFNAKICRMGL
jgi:endonuclease YncB( thermonuclease family)